MVSPSVTITEILAASWRRPRDQKMFFLLTWKTDGTRVFRNVVDVSRKALPPGARAKPISVLKIETQLGIVGIDPGQVYSAAAFFLPSDLDASCII